MARIITPEAILSYPQLFEPKAASKNAEPKYSACLVFPEGSDLFELQAAYVEAAKAKWGDKAGKVIRAMEHPTFRSDPDDVAAKGYPVGSTFLNPRTTRKPSIVSIYPDPATGKPMPVTDEALVYPGVIVKASLEPYTYDREKVGVTFGLGNIQIIRDGERLDGRAAATDEFDSDMGAVADLSDLTDEDFPDTVNQMAAGEDDLSDLFN